jgi:hypothetical protein
LLATGVVDHHHGKFITGVVATIGSFAAGIIETGGKLSISGKMRPPVQYCLHWRYDNFVDGVNDNDTGQGSTCRLYC